MKKCVISSLLALSFVPIGIINNIEVAADQAPTPRIKIAVVENYYTVTQFKDGSYTPKRDITTRDLRYNTSFVRTGYNNISQTSAGTSTIWRRQNTYNVW